MRTKNKDRRLVFVSNLFPDAGDDYRGLDNATLLHGLVSEHKVEVKAIGVRPSLWPGKVAMGLQPRAGDEVLNPSYVRVPYVPKVGSLVNHRLMAVSLGGVLRRVMAKVKPEVVLASWLYPDGCAVERCLRGRGVPLVLVTQGTDAHHYLEMPARRRAIVAAANQARTVVARSGDLRRRLVEAGVEEGRVEVIYNGVDTGRFRPRETSKVRGELGIDAKAKVLLFVGNLRPVKDPLMLLEAHAAASGRLGEEVLELHFVGQGEMHAEIEAKAKALGTADRVKMLGMQGADAVAARMSSADVLCISSTHEGLPNVLLEALASGLPVVSTDVGGISEVLEDGRHGALVKPGDAKAFAEGLERVLREVPNREVVASDGKKFTWERSVESYARVLWPGEVVV
ncbi:MAG: glycosyltransferase [Verrucomicrobiales bacterium]|nr:glycosyltransferase [Verrucomicrobiales bacterium]